MNKIFVGFCVLGLTAPVGFGHGVGGHVYRAEADEAEREHVEHASEGHADGKSFSVPVEAESRWWGVSLETGWTSREVHYGVDETGNFGAYTTALNVRLGGLNLSAWSGFGTGNDYQEWDFTAAYNFEFRDVFFVPGYNFRYTPGHGPGHEEEEDHGHEEEEDGHAGHQHKTAGHELFFVLGTTAIPYVTPSLSFVWDLSNTPGAYLDFRLDGEIPVYKEVLVLNPYALLSLNLGYNTRAYYGWNNFQFGLEAAWRLTRNVSLTGGVSYSVAMSALQKIDQGNVFWMNTGLKFEF